METLLLEGSTTYGIPATFPTTGPFSIYRGDAPISAPGQMVALCQAGPVKERHKQGSGLWEIPVSARVVFDRNGQIGDTEEEITASIKSYADDLEAVLTMSLLIDSADAGAGSSTPEQRLTTALVHVWELSEVTVEADTEMEGDPVCEVQFTAFCCHAGMIVT